MGFNWLENLGLFLTLAAIDLFFNQGRGLPAILGYWDSLQRATGGK